MLFSSVGTTIDNGLVWLCGHKVFESYVGVNILSPIIGFECSNVVNFFMSSHFVWGDEMKGKGLKSRLKHFLAYNMSYSVALGIRLGLIQLIRLTGLEITICNFIAMAFAGLYNFAMNNFVIFRNKRKNDTRPEIQGDN